MQMLQMVGAGLISSGVLLFLLGVLGAMTWGRINDKFATLDNLNTRLSTNIDAIFNRLHDCETDVAYLQGKQNGVKNE
jgi:hypothetical protein